MKLLKAIWNKLRGLDNQAAQAIADPINDANLAINDKEERIASFNTKIRDALARQKIMEADLKENTADVTKYENIAKLAIKASNDVDAAEVVKQKLMFQHRANILKEEIGKVSLIITNQRALLTQEQNRVEDAKNNVEILNVRLTGAQLRNEASNFGGLGDNDGLDSLKDAVQKAEATAEASEELSLSGKPNLEEKYNGVNQNIDEELARLKKEVLV